KLFGSDENTLLQVAPRVAHAIEQVPGVVEVKDGIVPAGDALNIEVDRVKASLQGVDPESVTNLLGNYLSGKVTTSVRRGPRLIDVRVWVPHDELATERDIENLQMQAPDGHLFPVKRVAKLTVVTGQPQIDRENLKRMAGVTARIAGRDLGSTMADVTKVLARRGLLPAGMAYELGGTYQQQRQSFQGLLRVMIAALLLVFILLLFLYRRFLVALAMLSVVLLAICWIFLALWLTHTELDIMSIMGMTMIIGIVTEVSIFYYSEYLELSPELNAWDRLIAAGARRARAIAMTTIAAILALITLALGIGQGSALLQPLAIAIIAGLVAQFPLVLVVLPGLLALYRSAR
ncbi:MAG: efflux RND transporter permease subunit, partial [Steroidobacteraceae bacterium]